MGRRNNRAARREQARFSASFDWTPLRAVVNTPAPPEPLVTIEPDADTGWAVRLYADPGYQPDRKRRYPIDTAPRCQAAWGYINMPERAERYTTDQHKIVKARIKRAMIAMGLQPKPIELELPSDWTPPKVFEATLTPELARELTDATDRRFGGHGCLSAKTRLREEKVDRFAELMAAGKWTGGLTVTIDKRDGTLIDGRHLCAAIARSGVAMPARFVEK